MRAVVLGLVGAVLLSGAARAVDRCPITAPLETKSRAEWSSDLKRSDLIGKTFTVERVWSGRDKKAKTPFGEVPETVAQQITDGSEHFIIIRGLTGNVEYSASFDPGEIKAVPIAWGSRDRGVEDVVSDSFVIDTGPLVKIGFTPRC